MATNNFLPFSPTDTGTNLLSQSDYSVAPDRTIGNQPGVASSKLVNKALRQSAFIISQLSQYLSDKTGTDLLDDANTAKLLAQFNAALLPLPQNITTFTASGNYVAQIYFFIASGSATVGATYTNNGVTYTVAATVASGTMIKMTGNGYPTVSGTLTKASGTGDATLTFYARRVPVQLRVQLTGGGGGGSGGASGTNTGALGSNGTNSTFGSTLLVANAGQAGTVANYNSGPGGTASLGTGVVGTALTGNRGGNGVVTGGQGGSSPFGQGGIGGYTGSSTGLTPSVTNSGAGGGGGGNQTGTNAGGGGGAGGYADGLISGSTLAATFAIVIGTGGAFGAGGAGSPAGSNGGAGSDGRCVVTESYQ